MRNVVRKYIERLRLITDFGRVAVALSGGADSVALLHVLHTLGYEVVALHCNFHLRGEESDRDEQFVRELCQQMGCTLEVIHFDTQAYAKEQGLSIEMAARDLRYAWFEQQRQAHSCESIAVAHHRDDQAETMLMNLTRGTGLRGLRGILPKNGYIVRPLLSVNRADIMQYLQKEGLQFVEDSTNQDTHIRRNHFRHEVLPLLREINPNITETLAQEQEQFCDYYQLAQERLQQLQAKALIAEDDNLVRYSLEAIASEATYETILYHILQPYGFQPDVVRQLAQAINGISGKQFQGPGHTAELHHGELLIYRKDEATQAVKIKKEVFQAPTDLKALQFPAADAHEALFDADKLAAELTIRHWQQGDTFAPFGMHGKSQKISDYFTDHHFSLRQKQDTWLLICGDEVAWIVGHRTSEKFRIDESTKQIARITIG